MSAATTKEKSMQTNPNETKGKNGQTPAQAKPNTADTAPVETHSDGEEKGTARRGVVPTMPAAIVYRHTEGGKSLVSAAIHHPVDGTSFVESGKGEGSAVGALVDSGFRLSALTADGPEWLAAKLPAGATLIGFATIKGFPLPTNK